jgi:FMN phosphatase YigB (HAD superfamily)
MTRTLRGILFDVGGVLLTIDHGLLAQEAAAAGTGSPDTAAFEEAEWRARVWLDEYLRGAVTESSTTRRRYMKYVWDEAWSTAGRVPADGLFEAWGRRIEDLHRRINIWRRRPDDAVHALQRLTDGGYVLGVVSNADGRVAALLAGAGLDGFFRTILDSAVEGVEKPDPEIFRRALGRLSLDPARTLYVGDFHALDVRGARGAGLGAVLMDPGGFWTAADVPRIRSLTDLADRLDRIVDGSPSPWLH